MRTGRSLATEDWLWAGLLAVIALIFYGRTMAPGLLYSDSGEFQVLAQSLGLAHPTGYPVYILFTKLISYVPIGTLAWRINLVSTLAATATVSGIYLLSRQLTRNRTAAIIASLGLLLSYTLWSQAIIAEVYTMGTLVWVFITALLWGWAKTPRQRSAFLFGAAMLTAISLGIHLYTILIAPAAITFVLMVLRRHGAEMKRPVLIAGAGTLAGLVVYLLSFYIIDSVNSITSFNATTMIPSQEAFGLTSADFSSFWQRLFLSITAPQWQDAMFPGGPIYFLGRIAEFLARFLALEFSLLYGAGFVLGSIALWREERLKAAFLLIALLVNMFIVLNYNPGDKHIFFLPVYLATTLAASVGLDHILTWSQKHFRLSSNVSIMIAIVLMGQHLWFFRAQALIEGKASFVSETYPYPVDDLDEPREVATAWVKNTPQDALLILDWRAMYSTYYIAQVEMDRTDIEILEALPHGTDGVLPETMIGMITEAVAADRPVYAQQQYNPLPRQFQLRWDPAVSLFKIESR